MAHRLEEHFPGNVAWAEFVETVPLQTQIPDLVQQLEGHGDIAEVIHALVGDQALAWISKSIPALDGLTPKDCLTSPLLIRRLKSMLMRMPS